MISPDLRYGRILQVAMPLVLGGIGQTVINATDTAFLGHMPNPEVAIGASAIGGLFYVTFFMLALGFAIGLQIVVARLDGEGKKLGIGPVIDHGVYFLAALAVLLFLILKIFGAILVGWFVQSEAIRQATVEFLSTRSYGIFFGLGALVFRAFFTGIGDTKIVTYTTLISAVGNIVLNYVFVFGHGVEPMGIAGSGLASTISEAGATVFAFAYTRRRVVRSDYALFAWPKPSRGVFREIFQVAVPLMFQVYISLWSWFIFFLIVEKMGQRPLAISNLVRNVYMVLMIPLMGFSNATNTLVSNLLGQGRGKEVPALVLRLCVLSLAFSGALVLLNLLSPQFLLSIFTQDASLMAETVGCIWVISGSLLLFSIVYILLSAVSGSGKTGASLAIESITLVFYLFASWYMAVYRHASIEWVWSVEYVYFLIMGILCWWYLQYKVLNKA